MKRISLLFLVCICCLPAFSGTRAEAIRNRLLNRDTTHVLVASHRGDWRNFPENSMEGINSAINMGVDIVEIDLQLTRDSVLILMHDPKLDRTTTGKGKIRDTDWSDIAKLKLRNGCHIRTGQRVPTLEQVLKATRGRVMLNLDKADRYFDLVYALAKKTGTERQIIMKGKLPARQIKEKYGDFLDEIIYMPIVNLDSAGSVPAIKDHLKELKPTAFELLYTSDDNKRPAEMRAMLKGKSLLWYNTLWDTMAGGHDDDASLKDINNGWGYLVDRLGAHIIQTDRPQMVLDYLRSRKLHD